MKSLVAQLRSIQAAEATARRLRRLFGDDAERMLHRRETSDLDLVSERERRDVARALKWI